MQLNFTLNISDYNFYRTKVLRHSRIQIYFLKFYSTLNSKIVIKIKTCFLSFLYLFNKVIIQYLNYMLNVNDFKSERAKVI